MASTSAANDETSILSSEYSTEINEKVNNMTLSKIQSELKKKGVSTNGNKSVLASKLKEIYHREEIKETQEKQQKTNTEVDMTQILLKMIEQQEKREEKRFENLLLAMERQRQDYV